MNAIQKMVMLVQKVNVIGEYDRKWERKTFPHYKMENLARVKAQRHSFYV